MLLQGVYTATKKSGELYYRSSITFHGKHISLGSYADEESAHRTYLEAGLLLNDREMTVDRFIESPHLLSFEKWVVLCNYRDNDFYVPTPIYMRPRFFYYYFDPHHFFIFSKEDLFFYANHKISRRGGHYFVADYGMQVNIMCRYGIKNYAVIDKDYRFKNGNPSDYRYENLEIINTYHGVSLKNDSSPAKYIAKIHLNGYLKIGEYDTAIEAAIAYNKAADYLKKAGINKNYQTNYIDQISSVAYADLYHNLPISSSITELSNQ